MFYNTQTARRPRKSPPAATELSRLLLHDVVCTSAASALQCIMQQNGPFVRCHGVMGEHSTFLSLVTLTLIFKLVRGRDQARLPCEFDANLFSRSGDI